MDVRVFAEALVANMTMSELNVLSNVVYDQRRKLALLTAPAATSEEMALSITDKMGAIKMYRERTGKGLMEAHTMLSVAR
jgi:ribosomal protein L7/L12